MINPLLITPGEPAGIGPDIVIQLAQQGLNYPTIIIADPDLLISRAKQLGLPIDIHLMHTIDSALLSAKAVNVFPVALHKSVTAGQLAIENAHYVLETLEIATAACMAKQAAGLITGPVHKAIINAAGIPFRGHTHFLAALTQSSQVAMFFIAPHIKVALVTDHLPLNRVSKAMTQERLFAVLDLLHAALQYYFQKKCPHIRVCGLNPHAGEGGYLGKEEQTIIVPVLTTLRARGLSLEGPLAADTAFLSAQLAQCDAIVAMYHDQGLIPFKHMAFEKGVNLTLGLPFLRTSVDHGTALLLAGTGRAQAQNLHQTYLTTVDLLHAATS